MKSVAFFFLCIIFTTQLLAAEQTVTWSSAATGTQLAGQVLLPLDDAKPGASMPAVVYLMNLSIPRLGQEPDEPIIDDLRKSGCLVLVLDYAHHPKAISPDLNADLIKLRQEIAGGRQNRVLTEYKVDPDHLFILMEGFRLKRDVEFARDGQRVMGIDIMYPSKPKKPVPVIMEITCSNESRMRSSSMLYCRDTILEGAEAAGFAAAMVDHPVAPPYKGLDNPMPESLYRMKAAVRTLRSLSGELQTSPNIGVIGFSRGGPFAAMLAVTNDRPELEGDGSHKDVSSNVQAAMIHGNRYDYLDLLPNDKDLAKFEKAWGPRDINKEAWGLRGALYFFNGKAAPMFLNTSNTEQVEYRDGLAKLDKRLTEKGIEHVYQVDEDGRGHQISTNPKTLTSAYEFFGKQLTSHEK